MHRHLEPIQTDVGDILLQDPSPMHEVSHGHSGATLVSLHSERVPHLRRTLVRRAGPIHAGAE